MPDSRRFRPWCLLFALALVACTVQSQTTYDEEHFYGIEIQERLGGYARLGVSAVEIDGRPITLEEHRVFLKISLFEMGLDTEIVTTSHIDPETEQYFYQHAQLEQGGSLETSWTVTVEDDGAHVVSTLTDREKIVPVPPEGRFEGALRFPHLVEAFAGTDVESRSWEIFDLRDAAFHRTTYTKTGTETLELHGETYDTLVFDRVNDVNAVRMRFWIDTATTRLVQAEFPNETRSYVADASVVKKIELVNVDERFTSSAGVEIADIQGITYMKVRLVAQPTGSWITPEDLNVQGQTFEGSVEGNRVEGVFEIRHARYDGTNAPAFPADYGDDEAIRRYLEPSDLVQSDNPEIAKKARAITEGSADSWEAAVRLSRWVAENIDYAIPGGGSASGALKTRAGECGAHSMLVAAFCRSVGIPARVVWGCMYIPNFGGAFGQHGWNEVYMGEAGWIPVDSTAHETDFVDSGHIRLGELETAATAINMIDSEVLDYTVGRGDLELRAETETAASPYDRFIGVYTAQESGRQVELIVQNEALVLDLPDPQPMLPMNDPDADGVWVCKLSPKISMRFEETDGNVTGMELHELVRMRRTRSPEAIDEDVPAELRSHLGTYLLAQLNAEFTVLYEDGRLAVKDPFEKQTIRLDPPDEQGRWLDEFGKNSLTFQADDEGNIESLTIDSVSRFRRS